MTGTESDFFFGDLESDLDLDRDESLDRDRDILVAFVPCGDALTGWEGGFLGRLSSSDSEDLDLNKRKN